MKLESIITEIKQLDLALVQRATSAVNSALTIRNWIIGAYLVKFEQHGENRAQYGKKLIPELANRLKSAGVKGLSSTNLKLCRLFFDEYPTIGQSLADELPSSLISGDHGPASTLSRLLETARKPASDITGLQTRQSATDESAIPHPRTQKILTQLSFTHLVELLKIDDPLKRTFYEIESISGRWSVRTLKRQIGFLSYERTGLSKDKEKLIALTNEQSVELSPRDLIRDPYIFEFLGLHPQETVEESDLESALLDHLQSFLLELGRGFCFEQRQRDRKSVV